MIERINLLPAQQGGQAVSGAEGRWCILALALAVTVPAALGAREIARRGTLERHRSALISARDRLLVDQQTAAAAVGRMKNLADEKARLQARLDALAAIQRGQRSWSELLVRISRITPDGLWLTGLGSSPPGVGGRTHLALRFQGKALSHERVSILLDALERDERFQEVELISTAKGAYLDREVVDFTLSCQVREP